MADPRVMPTQTERGEIRAAMRDASHYRTHRLTDGATMQHIPMWHVVNPDDPYLSRCGRVIVPESERPAESVSLRCQRPGCKQGWPS